MKYRIVADTNKDDPHKLPMGSIVTLTERVSEYSARRAFRWKNGIIYFCEEADAVPIGNFFNLLNLIPCNFTG